MTFSYFLVINVTILMVDAIICWKAVWRSNYNLLEEGYSGAFWFHWFVITNQERVQSKVFKKKNMSFERLSDYLCLIQLKKVIH